MAESTQENTKRYNSTLPQLKMPEYGRMVQEMVDYAVQLPTKDERQAFAQVIAEVMMNLNPKQKEVADYQHKIWDHLAWLSNYQLDIDYPFEITETKERKKPGKLSYPKTGIRLRHYGRLIESAMDELKVKPEGAERDAYVRLVANRMKRNLADWKGDGVEDAKVARDIAYYTDGKVEPDFDSPQNKLMQIGDNRFRTRKNKGLF